MDEGKMDYLIRGIEKKDIENIRQWRNAQLAYLRQRDMLTPEAQEEWWKKYTDECATYRPKNYLYVMSDGGELIAYGGFVHVDWDRKSAETSFLASPKRFTSYLQDFNWFLKELIELAKTPQWGLLELRSVTYRYYSETLLRSRPNDVHLTVLGMNGFKMIMKSEDRPFNREILYHRKEL